MGVNPSRPAVRHWTMVAFSALTLALAFAARTTLGLVMPIWSQELGWSRSFISGSAAAALLVMAAMAPFAGRLVDRHGLRITLAIGLSLIPRSENSDSWGVEGCCR